MTTNPGSLVKLMAEEIETLRKENDRLRTQAQGCARDQSTTQFCAEAVAAIKRAEIAEENERLIAEMSKAKEIEIDRLEAENEWLRGVLRGLVTDEKDDPCWYDHHGYCQAHFLGDPCQMSVARAALKGDDDD